MTERDVLLLIEAREAARSGEARRLREEAELSQVEVASVVDVAPATINRWEGGTRVPRGDGAVRWARFLRKLAERERTVPAEPAA